jgi:translation initiation factor 5B
LDVAAAADDWEAEAAAGEGEQVQLSTMGAWDDEVDESSTKAAQAAVGGGGGDDADDWEAEMDAPVVAKKEDWSSLPLEERIERTLDRRAELHDEALAKRDPDNLRSPIVVVMGHVDTGKTKLLDKLRRTNVQEGEAGGITQQIGATFFPMEKLRAQTDKVNRSLGLEYKLPGLLVIDTPGHESFSNLRSRGSSLCDIAVLVVDIMHGLEPQTIESLNMLRKRRTPFIVALNKVDRLYGWKTCPNATIQDALTRQDPHTLAEFETRTKDVITQIMEQGLNAKLYYENDNFREYLSIVPTSAIKGEGVPDLLMLLVQLSQTMLAKKLQWVNDVQCTVLEVKTIEGLGTTIDVVLLNGELKEGDTIVVCGMAGPIVTKVRGLLTPKPMREIRIKADYVHHKSINTAMGIKIAAHDLEKAVAGTSLLVLRPGEEVEALKGEVMEELEAALGNLARVPVGVTVQASTLGSLEALMEYLRSVDPPIPVANVRLGPIHKKDVIAASVMLEHQKEYATILAFDVRTTPEAAAEAESMGVRIFSADIIYHLTDMFEEYMAEQKRIRQEAAAAHAVFPCILNIVPKSIFNKRNPIVMGVDVAEGVLKVGTPLAVLTEVGRAGLADTDAVDERNVLSNGKAVLQIGKVTSIEHNHEELEEARPGDPSVAIRVEGNPSILAGRHFTQEDVLYSRVTRASIDVLKRDFRDKMEKSDWQLIARKLKPLFNIT